MIAKLWANKILSGARTLEEVPAKLKKQVEEILAATAKGE